MKISTPDRLSYRARELAPLLGLSRSALSRLTRTNQIPHRRVGHAVLYPADQIRAWLADGGANPGSVPGLEPSAAVKRSA